MLVFFKLSSGIPIDIPIDIPIETYLIVISTLPPRPWLKSDSKDENGTVINNACDMNL